MNNYDEIERKIFLIKNYLEDNLSVAEEEELRVWLDESPKHRETFQRIRDKKILFAKLEYRQRQEKETDWKVICRKTGIGSSRRLWYIRVARYAAVFFGLCLGVWLYFRAQVSQPQESTLAAISMDTICPGYKQAYIELKSGERIALGNTGNKQEKRIKGMVLKEEKDGVMILPGDSLADKAVAVEKSWIVVPRGGEYQLILPDGTKVWLNSDSKITYPLVFSGNARKVILTGEAYFEVTKNSGQPFIVQTENFNVKVLGTSFCINTFGDNGKVYTALESGVVEMDCGRENTLILAPGQVAELDVRRPGACVRMSEVSVEQLVAWKKGLFCFRQTSLPDILKQVARYYDVHFMNLEDAEGEAYTGDISRNVSLEVLLGAISAQTTDIQFKIVNRTVYITKKRD